MKINPVLRLSLLPALTCACYGANLAFPVSGVTNGAQLGVDWTQSDSARPADKLAWYSTIGSSYEGVSVGGFYNDFLAVPPNPPFEPGWAGVTDGGFTVGHATDAVAVGGATIDWHFAINPSNNGFSSSLNDFSISLFDLASNPVLTINLTKVGLGDPNHWEAFANGTSFGFIEFNALYSLQASFGAVSGLNVDIVGSSTISYSNPLFISAGTFGTVEVGIAKGSGADYGDGSFTVVPEPGTTMLFSLLPAFFVLRRRR